MPLVGRLRWIGLRGARTRSGSQAPTESGPMQAVEEAQVDSSGLVGDRYSKADGKRSVTLVQAEHLPAIAALLGRSEVEPACLRRNLVVEGTNLQALKRARFLIGEVELQGTGDCHPCVQMDRTLGADGEEAMRGHGGITARVIRGGWIRRGDRVVSIADA